MNRRGGLVRRLQVIGAHPDDCEFMAGGLAALCRKAGWEVLFTAVTNGNAGHHEMKPAALAARRVVEARRSAGVIGARSETLGEPDGRLYVTECSTAKVIRSIRRFRPHVLVCHRTCDYHRDHRYAAQLVLDASFVLQVPLVCPDSPALERMPLILYAWDRFTEGPRFRADVLIDTTRVEKSVVRMLLCHVSQMAEWLPWLGGIKTAGLGRPVPSERVARGLAGRLRRIAATYQAPLRRRYRRAVRAAEAFQISEYGARPGAAAARRLLPA